MADINAGDVIKVVVGVVVSVAMMGILVPILNSMTAAATETAPAGSLYEYRDIVNIIPLVLVIVILIMAIGPVIRKKF